MFSGQPPALAPVDPAGCSCEVGVLVQALLSGSLLGSTGARAGSEQLRAKGSLPGLLCSLLSQGSGLHVGLSSPLPSQTASCCCFLLRFTGLAASRSLARPALPLRVPQRPRLTQAAPAQDSHARVQVHRCPSGEHPSPERAPWGSVCLSSASLVTE